MSKKLTNAQIKKNLEIKLPDWSKSPILFIKDMWHLTPHPVKPEYQTAIDILRGQREFQSIRPEWFGEFQRGAHITWQQWLILLSVEAAINNTASKRISVASAHGIGKTCSIALTILWFLFTHKQAQIAVTAPTSKQLFDVLWKELSIWINLMPVYWRQYFEWQSTYIRMKQNPNEWFASAKTAKKDSTEALAGVHGESVMVIADEASGVVEEVFNTMEGSLTEKDILIILISNPTRLSGYFWETHKKPAVAEKWQKLQFNNLNSPIVRDDYNQDIIDRYGKNSDEYRIRVLGQFPNEADVDDKGYVPILGASEIKEIEMPARLEWVGEPIMGIDPAGEGRDSTVWVIRDQFKAAVVLTKRISTELQIAQQTRMLAKLHKVKPENIAIDSFGIGSNIAAELAKEWFKINAINVGDTPKKESEKEIYLNLRALYFMRVRKAIRSGFELVRDKAWIYEIPTVKFCRNTRGKIQILAKKEIRKESGKSPDNCDALSLAFFIDKNKTSFKITSASQRNQISTDMIGKQSNQQFMPRPKTMNNLHSAI